MVPVDTRITVEPTEAKEAEEQHFRHLKAGATKLNRYMLPFVLTFSVISSIDRANVAFAAVEMNHELGFTAETYGLGAAIFFVSYSIFQIPSNILLLLTSGPMMLGAIAVAWGFVAASMAAVNSRGSFLLVRFLLGIAEAGTVPGIWAYLSHIYPASQITLPTTFYMAGITAAQALGAPLAAALLSMHGVAGMSGWRWLFIIEGIPSVLMGVGIWLFLPASLSHCRMLTAEEQQHMQAAINCPQLDIQTASSLGSSASSSSASGSSSSSSADAGLTKRLQAAAGPGAAGAAPATRVATMAADLAATLRCRVVWCASGWRFLYLITLNGLIFFVPLLVHALMDGAQSTASGVREGTSTMILTSVPYIAGVLTHIANGWHSKRTGERRWHIVASWACGGALMCVMPVAWMRGADVAAFVLLVLACMGVMGCDGVDVSWIVSLFAQLTSSQRVLALAVINTMSNFGSFIGPYLNGFLKTSTGAYFAGCWLMGGVVLLAAGCVAAFPLSWAAAGSGRGGPKQQQAVGDMELACNGAAVRCSS